MCSMHHRCALPLLSLQDTSSVNPPLLMLHGAGHAAWCYKVHPVPSCPTDLVQQVTSKPDALDSGFTASSHTILNSF